MGKLPGSDGWEPPRAVRYSPERDDGTLHYLYVFRRASEAEGVASPEAAAALGVSVS